MSLTKPTTPTDWTDEAAVAEYQAAADAYYKAQLIARHRAADKRTTFAGFDAQLQGRNAQSRKIARNTYLKRRGENIAVMLHSTDIVTYSMDGTITLNTGGWLTMVTRDRIVANTPRWLSIYSDRGVWYVQVDRAPVGKYRSDKPAKTYRYHDGIKFTPRGRCLNPMKTVKTKALDKKNKQTDKDIKTYVDGWIETAVTGQMPLPSGGDCWYCALLPESDESGHLREHIREQYHVPSLIVKAARAKKYGNPVYALQLVHGIRADADGTNIEGTTVNVSECRKLLTWYLRRHLSEGVARK